MQLYKYLFFGHFEKQNIKNFFFTGHSLLLYLNVINSFRVYKREVNESSSIIRFPIMLVLDDIVILYIESIVTICDLWCKCRHLFDKHVSIKGGRYTDDNVNWFYST